MSTDGKDRSGRVRVRCSAHIESGSCPNLQTYLDRIDFAALSGLKKEPRHPEVIAEYVRTYHEERKRPLPTPSGPRTDRAATDGDPARR